MNTRFLIELYFAPCRVRTALVYALWSAFLLLFFVTKSQATYTFTEGGVTSIVTQTASGITATMTVTYNTTTGVATWHHTQTAAGGGAWIVTSVGNVSHVGAGN